MNKGNKRILQPEVANPSELKLKEFLEARMIGQREAIDLVCATYRTALSPIRKKKGVPGNLMFLGPTGTGKTYLAELLAEFLGIELIVIEGNNLAESHSTSFLIGSPPGYVGHDIAPALHQDRLDAARGESGCKFNVVLIDEMEKAHRQVCNSLLRAFDKGFLNMAREGKTDFRNTIFIMTGNLGMTNVKTDEKDIGFREKRNGKLDKTVATVKAVTEAYTGHFAPEFRGRIGNGKVVFSELTHDELLQVVNVEVGILQQDLFALIDQGKYFKLEVDAAARGFIQAEAIKFDLGARMVETMVKQHLYNPLNNELIKGTIGDGDLVVATHEAGKSVLTFEWSEGEGIDEPLEGKVDPQSVIFQRKLRRAIHAEPKQNYQLGMRAKTMKELMAVFNDLGPDLKSLFKVELVRTIVNFSDPIHFWVKVKAAEEQIYLIKLKYPMITSQNLDKPEPPKLPPAGGK